MTFIYITHSQEEALTMSDRILLMRRGRVDRAVRRRICSTGLSAVSPPIHGFREYYALPRAQKSAGGRVEVSVGDVSFQATCPVPDTLSEGREAALAVRAERLLPCPDGAVGRQRSAVPANGTVLPRQVRGPAGGHRSWPDPDTELGPVYQLRRRDRGHLQAGRLHGRSPIRCPGSLLRHSPKIGRQT